jgi:hypothetical protein
MRPAVTPAECARRLGKGDEAGGCDRALGFVGTKYCTAMAPGLQQRPHHVLIDLGRFIAAPIEEVSRAAP